ncbi:23S rRNA (adenine(2030)-N(6))-methyltransferase RlmJ [Candidatus Saccharibacteria bacterium]|nr:23S rRNA (adenine(2030)-N(6))-methyltransferase RlmJ [Candidatus Saccharibacteria bacterium]
MKYRVRVTSGKYKNAELKSPRNRATHPMSERARTGLFNMLGDLTGKTVLDLYAGTGALGLESLSRGAERATFVEVDPQVARVLKDNLKNAGVEEVYEVYVNDVKRIGLKPEYDVIFVDPPYVHFNEKTVLKMRKFLKPGGIFVVSSPKEIELGGKTATFAGCRITILP